MSELNPCPKCGNHPLVGCICRPPSSIETAAEEMAIQLRGVLDWAGKDKRMLTRRGWTLDKEMASLNNACAALLHYQQAKEGK